MKVTIPYKPLPAARKFHASPARNILAVGGKRSGKTNAMLMQALMLSFEYPNNIGMLARETFDETREAIIEPLIRIVPREVVEYYPTAQRKIMKFVNGSMIYFRSLDEHRKSKGLTLGWAGIDEIDSVTLEDLIQLDGQISLKGVHPVLMATCNPVSKDHWVYRRWVEEQLPGYEYVKFPTKDNTNNLPDGYIEHMLATMPESWVKRYIDGEWGSIIVGERVYPEFGEDLHVSDKVRYNPAIPVVRTWDFGNNMAVLFSQSRDKWGIDFINEVFKKRMTVTSFAQIVFRMSEELFPGAIFEDYGDIAGTHTDSTSGMSPIDVIRDRFGVRIRYESIPLRESLHLVREKLSQIVGGTTVIRISPKCKLTIEALNGGYVHKKSRDGSIIKDVPAEDDTFEHVMDCFRYRIWTQFAYRRAEKVVAPMPENTPVFEGTSW